MKCTGSSLCCLSWLFQLWLFQIWLQLYLLNFPHPPFNPMLIHIVDTSLRKTFFTFQADHYHDLDTNRLDSNPDEGSWSLLHVCRREGSMTCLRTSMKLLTRIGLAYLMNNSVSVLNCKGGKVVSEIISIGIYLCRCSFVSSVHVHIHAS